MKSIILFVLVIIVNSSYAQEKNNLQKSIFKVHIEENHYLVDDIFTNSLTKIEEFKAFEPVNNSEGKFPKYKSEQKILLESSATKDLIPVTLTDNQIGFINDLIMKKLIERNEMQYNEAKFYGDRAIVFSYNFPKAIDRLNKNFNLTDGVDVQIGKNIYKNIQKIYKSEIDKTLQSSLNLLAINF
ncbi:MAG: hypothetical protein AB8B78_13040 [Polaribacter sp.]